MLNSEDDCLNSIFFLRFTWYDFE